MIELRALIKKLPSDFCLICGGGPAIIGIFAPEYPGDWGGSNGKTRLFRYCICAACHERQGTPEKVEKIIKHELQAGAIEHGK